MAEFPAMNLWTDAYMADTSHLTTTEHGAYLLILMAMWRAGGNLPNDETRLARTARLSLDKWRRIAPTIMSFLTVDGAFVSQKRLKLEFKNALARSQKASAAGKISAQVKSLKSHKQPSARVEAELPSECNSNPTLPLPLPLEDRNLTVSCPKPVRTRVAYPSEFEEFWKGYPTDALMSKSKAFDQWKRLSPADREKAVKSVPAFCSYVASHPTYRAVHAERYFSERRFDGFAEIAVLNSAIFYVKPDTPQWRSWVEYYRKEKGRSPPADKNGGWGFPSEWPPNSGERRMA